MDDTQDGRYSRPPHFEDLLSLCRSLNEAGVQYLLIGGFAVGLHGLGRATKDIDLLLDPSVDNIRRLKKGMACLPDNAVALIEDTDVQRYQVVRVADEIVIDLMAAACGIGYHEASRDIEWFEIEGVAIPVASKKLLIRLKDTLRPEDQIDVLFLRQQIKAEEEGE